MKPQFPKFKKITNEDQELIESITYSYLPYSDFNFVSLFSWNTKNQTRFSIYNDNLIIETEDYDTDNKVVSFLGSHSVQSTMEILVTYAKHRKITELSFLPEINFVNHKDIFEKYSLEEDRDQFDYIYDLNELISMDGRIYMKRRNMLRMFEKSYRVEFRVIDLRLEEIQQEIIDLFNRWAEVKKREGKYYDKNEIIALKKLFTLCPYKAFISLGVYDDDKLIGFSILEGVQDNYSIFHFEKTDHEYKGITEYIKVNTAKHLVSLGIKYFNMEQDLGIERLKRTKLSYNPSQFLKKYKLTF